MGLVKKWKWVGMQRAGGIINLQGENTLKGVEHQAEQNRFRQGQIL